MTSQWPHNLFDLSGRVAVVSGASRGIGEAISKALAAHGAHVIATSRKIDGCEKVVADIRQAGGSAEAGACHIGDMDHIDRLFRHVQTTHGRIDIMVNNAATNPYFGPIGDTDLAAFQKTLDVNIRGYFFMSARAAKLMASRGGGAIVNVASVNGIIPGPMQGIYSISKAAVIAMTRGFAVEYASANVRVNAVLPGGTDTQFAAKLVHSEEVSSRILPHIPMGRFAQPEEMAGAVIYLVSPSASYTTGVCLNVDGGYLSA
jgi:NAD(P)-dependent dehydrogenase (short-subunit alcohol dehydrogenase family)